MSVLQTSIRDVPVPVRVISFGVSASTDAPILIIKERTHLSPSLRHVFII